MTKVLVLNSGSSSIKFQLFQMPEETILASGIIDRIGEKISTFNYELGDFASAEKIAVADHKVGLERVTQLLLDNDKGVLQSPEEVAIIGHRVVHGGSFFSDATKIDNAVKNKIKSLFSLAPLHNPANLLGIEVAEVIFPKALQVAVFDTAFFQTLPQKVYQFAIDQKFLDENGIRVYGAHGTSHKFVSDQTAEFLGKMPEKLITAHLGNGCSMTAIKNGKSVDHSMGLTPLEGLVMGTRSGTIDPSVIFYLIEELGYSAKEVNTLLNKKSGMLGLTGASDLRDIQQRAEAGDASCKLALELNIYRIKKYIGAYAASLNGLDTLVFTAGIGENSAFLRKMVCQNMDYLGIKLDEIANDKRDKGIRSIAAEDASVEILIVPTNEELEIARQAYGLTS
ncbi:MAG: acetate kinase [Leeuwenhoekiella sp.]